MENLFYLVAVIAVSVIVSVIIVVRSRKPTSMEAGIEAFNRELRALAPDKRPPMNGRARKDDKRPGATAG
jgi:hypothetical protein